MSARERRNRPWQGGSLSEDDTASVMAATDIGRATRLSWPAIVALAGELAEGHAHRYGPPTLRRVHYLLVSSAKARELGYVNSEQCYKTLSARTARAREAGEFPDLVDTNRTIEPASGYRNAASAAWSMARWFSYDRGLKLPVALVLVSEKAGIVPVLASRFDWLPITSVRGYSSLSHAKRIAGMFHGDDRPAAAIYVGDYDPSGLDIDRDLSARLPFPLHRVALTREQVQQHRLPPAPAKQGDSRSAAMAAAHGKAVQVELDALPASILLGLVGQAIEDIAGVSLDASGKVSLPELDRAEESARLAFADLSARLREAGL